MARFKYMGEIANDFLVQQGPCLAIIVPLKNGTKLALNAPNQTTGFVIGEDIGTNITDDRAVRYMRGDARFDEIK